MVSHFDPRTGADRSVAYARVTHPVSQSGLTSSRPKTLQSARNVMQTWEQEVALKSIMPLFGEGVFRRRSFNLFAVLRTAIINHLDDQMSVSMMKQGPPISTTNMIQTLSREEQGEDEEMKKEVTQEETFATVQQFRKGKGKGKGKGKKGL